MQHYLVDAQSSGSVDASFPHVPFDLEASIQDYLEDKPANGLELVSMAGTNPWQFVFKVVAK